MPEISYNSYYCCYCYNPANAEAVPRWHLDAKLLGNAYNAAGTHKLQVLVKFCDCSRNLDSPKLGCQEGR